MNNVKVFILFLLLAFSFVLVGCKEKPNKKEPLTIEEMIKADYFDMYLLLIDKNATIDRVVITNYYGVFNNSLLL